MFMLFLTFNVVAGSSGAQESTGFFNGAADIRNNRGLSNMHQSFMNPVIHNATYIDKDDNLLRVPTKYHEEPKTKNKIKKSAKRTVQKIIKKNKLKSRKLYLFPATAVPTIPSKSDDNEYTNDISTTEHNSRKRLRKISKYARYPMPFQNLHKKESYRFKRQDRNLYILKDLDEIEFLSKEKDHDKVVAHVKNYW